jgi:methionine synthase II (cobalamin-independent)
VWRTSLLLVLLTLPAEAAPRLKDRKPAPDPEDARIAALKAKYDKIRSSGDPSEKTQLHVVEMHFHGTLAALDRLDAQPGAIDHQQNRRAIVDGIRQRPTLRDLYDIAMYDRKKAAAKE